MKLFFTIAFTLLAFTLSAAEDAGLQPVPNPKPILQDLQQKMSSLKSVALDFTQERHLKLFTDPLKSEGVMLCSGCNPISVIPTRSIGPPYSGRRSQSWFSTCVSSIVSCVS